MPSGQSHKSHLAIDFARKSDVLSFFIFQKTAEIHGGTIQMTSRLSILTIFLGIIIAVASLAFDVIADDEQKVSAVVEKLEQNGQSSIVSFEQGDDGWEFTAAKRFHVDRDSLNVVESEKTDEDIPPSGSLALSMILKKVEEAGYIVLAVEFDDGVWEVDAIREVEIDVDPMTGALIKVEDDD
jgi:hypothetical protein